MNHLHLFNIQTGSNTPIYRQLADQLRRLVASAQLKAGQELPSVRDLAAHLAINPMTISKAYGLMETEGLVERRRGKHMRVAAMHVKRLLLEDRLNMLRPTLVRAADEAHQLELRHTQAVSLFRTILRERAST